jgi:dTDP-4-dehydrorhamnose 3,5-epimerase
MNITHTPILGLQVIEPIIRKDNRGYFIEAYHQKKLAEAGVHYNFVQDNQSYSKQGTIRGLHYQLNPYAQTKLIRVVVGKIWDVAVDIRQGSPTFGRWEGILLSASNQKQLLIPQGYAHGFSVLSKRATVLYKCDNLYQPDAEAGIYCFDTQIGIDWKLSAPPLISAKDQLLPSFSQAVINFTYEQARS